MAQWEAIQRSFSAGEVGPRLIMRDDDAGHKDACLELENYYPTLQGSAVRMPGTRYIYTADASDSQVRIIPYLTPRNTKAVIEIAEGSMRVIDDLGLGINDDIVAFSTSWTNITPNFQCRDTFFPWVMNPLGEVVAPDGDILGWDVIPGRFSGTARISQSEAVLTTCSMDVQCVPIPEAAPNGILLQADIQYANNFAAGNTPEDEKIARIEVRDGPEGTGNLLYEEDLDYLQVGQTFTVIRNIGGSYAQGDVLYLRFWFQATRDDEKDTASTPNFLINQLGLRAPVTVSVVPEVVTGTVPWLESELDDIQFVQSPYTNSTRGNLYGKQVVFTHGNHPPQELIFTGSQYELRPIFTNDTDQHYLQWEWGTKGYPAACSSYQGRLVLAGSNLEVTNSPTGTNSEKVWATEVNRWYAFTNPTGQVPDPADSVDFTAIYRSPINWVQGQKSLLIGAESMEYAATSDNVLAPNDLGIFMQSTHGSSRVQPAGFGAFVLFAGEAGRRLRAMQYVDEDAGWVAPDLGLQHPSLFDSGIRRIVRMRNPHQMAIVVRNDGQVALLHYDTNANILGWSRMKMNDPVIDACVLTDKDGADVLLLAVRRRINGAWKITIEGLSRWYDGAEQVYLNSSVLGVNNPPSPTITGLDHLEGAFVQVNGDGAFLGTYQVSGGSVTVAEKAPGVPRELTWFSVGLAMTSRIRTMPLITSDPASKKRYPKISVATLNSARPIINGERPDDRSPITSMDIEQPRDILRYNEVANLGSDETQVITIEENLPVRSEVIGVFGKVAGNSV